MLIKEEIKKLEKEIAIIDKTLTVLFAVGIIELIFTIMGCNRFDLLSLGIVLTCAILFSRYLELNGTVGISVGILRGNLSVILEISVGPIRLDLNISFAKAKLVFPSILDIL